MGCGASAQTMDSGDPLPGDEIGEEIASERFADVDVGVMANNATLRHPFQNMFEEASANPWFIYSVYSFLSWSQRASDVVCLSRDMRKFFNPNDKHGQYWLWLCQCLCAEAQLHCPATDAEMRLIAGGNGNYLSLFQDLWPLRHRFVPTSTAKSDGTMPERFRVSTFCRMRPSAPATLDGAFAEALLSTPMQLPLNQRVVLMQQKHPGLTRGAAMKLCLNKKCGAGGPLSEDDEMIDEDTRISTPARTRTPAFGDAAVLANPSFTASVLSVTPGPSGSVLTMSPGVGIRNWSFDNVFGDSISQSTVYERCGLRLATNLVNGQSGALIAYGQTGSGKTHTMFGSHAAKGLVPRIADDVLKAIEIRRKAGFEIELRASFVEVFGNDLKNLLGGEIGANRGQNQRMGHRYVLDGQCEEPVPDGETFATLLARGEENKHVASTEMNERSTRAHTLIILRLRQYAPGQEKRVESMLSLVDLGGSERVSKSKANEKIRAPGALNVGDEEVSRVSWQEYYHSRERITETNHINKGLLILKRCVTALNERQQCAKEGRPLPRVPFADSKLTMLLEPALGGESSTSIIICGSPEDRHAEETVQSLRFGEMCSCVEYEHKGRNDNINAAVEQGFKQLDAEIKQVEASILRKERWEWKKTIRTDVVDEKDTGSTLCHHDEKMELGGNGAVEIMVDDGHSKKRVVEHEVWSQVLVGAEVENARRDELLKARQRLLGTA